jgi:hypothetical protein
MVGKLMVLYLMPKQFSNVDFGIKQLFSVDFGIIFLQPRVMQKR